MKTRLFVIGIPLLIAGVIFLVIGLITFLETKATKENIESMIKAGSSVPVVTYDQAWLYLETSVVFFVIGGFLLIWRKRK
jgi:hypothetical protein